MVRRKITPGDWLRGAGQSIRNGTAMNPLATQQQINAQHDQRLRDEMKHSFGAGTVAGDRNWEPPVYATTRSGKPVTVSFGRGQRKDETLICDGHVSMDQFYARARDGREGPRPLLAER